MKIRTETPADYADIASLHARAFDHRASEATIVALLRQRRGFSPALALVAEIDGTLAGHALFSPYDVNLLGQTVAAVNLAPLAVHPRFQQRGIGARLLREGHELARSAGYALSFLLGHPSYYPRFGYQTHAYGSSTLTVSHPQAAGPALDERPVLDGDGPALLALWQHEERTVDMALNPGAELLDWISPDPAIQALVFTLAGQIVGYSRFRSADPAHPHVFLAATPRAAQDMAATLAQRAGAAVALPLHSASASAWALGPAVDIAWEAAMALSLAPNPFDDYYPQVRAGQRPPGRMIWPVMFDL